MCLDVYTTVSVLCKSKVQIIIVDEEDALSELWLLQTHDLSEQDQVTRVVVYWTEKAEEKYPFILTNSFIRRWEETEESAIVAILSNIKKYRQHPGKTLHVSIKKV